MALPRLRHNRDQGLGPLSSWWPCHSSVIGELKVIILSELIKPTVTDGKRLPQFSPVCTKYVLSLAAPAPQLGGSLKLQAKVLLQRIQQ